MSMWERVQKLARAYSAVNKMGDELLAVSEENMALRGERDRARDAAVALEQENALLAGASPVCAICAQVVVPVPMRGEAR